MRPGQLNQLLKLAGSELRQIQAEAHEFVITPDFLASVRVCSCDRPCIGFGKAEGHGRTALFHAEKLFPATLNARIRRAAGTGGPSSTSGSSSMISLNKIRNIAMSLPVLRFQLARLTVACLNG